MGEMLLFLVAGSLVLLGRLLAKSQLAPRDAWWTAARSCGLVIVPTGKRWSPLVAQSDRMRITIRLQAGDEQIERKIVVARRDRHSQAISIQVPMLGGVSRSQGTSGGTATGDHGFDSAAMLFGPSTALLAALDATTRAGLITLARNGPVEVSEGEVRVTVAEPRLELSRERLLALLIALSDRLHSEMDLVSALALNARSDPHPGVRKRCLEELARKFRDSPQASEALRAALADGAPEVRIRAARELGEEGRALLRQLAGDAAAADTIVAAAIIALGRNFAGEEFNQALKLALRHRRISTATACIERLGLGDVPNAAATLGRILRVDRGALAVAAAGALGRLANGAAESLLVEAIGDESAPVALAAVEALGASGSIAAVPALRQRIDRGDGARSLLRAARRAIGQIQARVQGADPGQLSLAPALGGSLSLAPEVSGQLSLAAGGSAGQLSNPAGSRRSEGEPEE
ncbi:MAG: HEAT repeat domain-containing protein [Thermoanaerobaculia bacterium]